MIVITTPTGDIGHRVLANVLADGDEPVRVIVRDAGRLSPSVRDRVEIVEGSHADPAVLGAAFAGADSVFWVVPPNFRMDGSARDCYRDFTKPGAEASARHGVERMVVVSALGRGVAVEAGMVSASIESVDLIAASGVSYRALAMPGFMENFLREVDSIRDQGVFFQPMDGDLKLPHVAVRDIAAVGSKLMLDRSWSGHEDVPVLGPEDLSFNQMAEILTEVLGRPVRFEEVAIDAYADQLRQHGASEGAVRGMVDMFVAKNNGLDNHAKRTPETSTPTSFRQWAEEVLKPAIEA